MVARHWLLGFSVSNSSLHDSSSLRLAMLKTGRGRDQPPQEYDGG